MDDPAVQQVRRFNRTVADRIGALDDRFLGRPRPMGEARTLWEIEPEGTDVRALRARLAIDSGYMSRLLRSLERQGLVTLGTSPSDGRVRRAVFTEAGLAERAELDRRSDGIARGILEPLSDSRRAELLAAMKSVERLLTSTMVSVALEEPTSADARWCIEQYFAELDVRFDAGFDPSLSISADAHELRPPAGELLVARLRGEPIGCGALKFHPGKPAEVKRMWVAPSARGLGLGRRLLQELEGHALESGVKVLRLETNGSLTEAIALYRSAGYREVPAFNDEPYAQHWFEKRITRPSRNAARRGPA
jgi:DNA-binding MarR family transcriptional regulator/GNAT superfamily N-acetyltransferase